MSIVPKPFRFVLLVAGLAVATPLPAQVVSPSTGTSSGPIVTKRPFTPTKKYRKSKAQRHYTYKTMRRKAVRNRSGSSSSGYNKSTSNPLVQHHPGARRVTVQPEEPKKKSFWFLLFGSD